MSSLVEDLSEEEYQDDPIQLIPDSGCGTMSSLAEDIPEEEYLDDPIQLIPDSDVMTKCCPPEEFTAYKKKSYVAVTFFNLYRNIRLLNNCRPLYIKLVDCELYPSYNKKGLTVNLNSSNAETEEIEKDVDYKKNKGLVGMKVCPSFEVIEIDDSIDESQTKVRDKLSSSETTLDLNYSDDEGISENNDNSKDKTHVNIDMTIESSPVTEIIRTKNAVKELSHTNVSDVEIVDSKECPNLRNPVATDEEAEIPNKNGVSEQKKDLTEDSNASKTEGAAVILIGDKKTLHKVANENPDITKELRNNCDVVQVLAQVEEKNCDPEYVTKVENCSASPVLPCTPPKRIKKYSYHKPDTSKLVISQPKDFNDSKFKPNRLCSPKTAKASPKNKGNGQEDNNKNIKTVDSEQDIQTKGTEIIVKLNLEHTRKIHEELIDNRAEVEDNTLRKKQQMHKYREISDMQGTNVSDSEMQANVTNKEQVIKCKLSENINKKAVEHPNNSKNTRCDIQINKSENLVLKVSTQQGRAISSMETTCSMEQINSENPSCRSKKRPYISHSIDTILDQNQHEGLSNSIKKIGSTVLQSETNNHSPGFTDKRSQILSKGRIRPYSGSITNLHNMVNELARHQHYLQNRDLAYRGSPNMSPKFSQDQLQVPSHNINSTTTSKTFAGQPTDAANEDNTATVNALNLDIGHNKSLRDDSTTLRTTQDFPQNSSFENQIPKDVVPNGDLVYERNKSNLCQNNPIIAGYLRQAGCIPPYVPQHRQVIRPVTNIDPNSVFHVTNYQPHAYTNINNNYLPNHSYPGRSTGNRGVSYWPCNYTRIPPTSILPPPLPQNCNRVHQNVSHSNEKNNISVKNKIGVIEQIIFNRAPKNSQTNNNNLSARPNLKDIKFKNNSPVTVPAATGVSNSPPVSSKHEMLEELEKEIRIIHHEFGDSRLKEKCSNVERSDPRKQKNFDNSESLKNTVPCKSSNKIKNVIFKPNREDHNKPKNLKTSLPQSSLKRSGEVLAKYNTKKKKSEEENASPGYSAPILPIPSFKQTLDILTRANNDAQKRLRAYKKTRWDQSVYKEGAKDENVSLKKEKVKKISLDEYKKRSIKVACEKKEKGEKVRDMVEAKNSDNDLGYDSDSTIVLTN